MSVSRAVGVARAETARRLRRHGFVRYSRRAVYWSAVAAVSLALLVVLATVGARLVGYSPHVMYGGSMGSTAPLGSVALIEGVSAESLEVGDVILFRPPSSGQPRDPVMHRVISIEEVDGQRVFRTKGDSNTSADPWEMRLVGDGGRLVFVVPYVGYLFWFLQTRMAWVLIVLPLVAYLGFVTLRRIWAPVGRTAPEAEES
jgi:signal peptidase I